MGFRNRYKNKRDSNEGEIIAALEAHGITVERMDTPVDLLCGYGGQTYAVEVKVEGAKLTPAQKRFFDNWKGHVTALRSVKDAEEWAQHIRRQHDTWKQVGEIARKIVEAQQ